jgi:biopolymer transport protein ExbB/TolQ
MAVTAVVVVASAYSAYSQAEQSKKAEKRAEANQKQLEAESAQEQEMQDKAAALESHALARRKAVVNLSNRKGRSSTILSGNTPTQTLG